MKLALSIYLVDVTARMSYFDKPYFCRKKVKQVINPVVKVNQIKH